MMQQLAAHAPPGVKPGQQQLSVAARNAEALFEAKNVADIRQIEARTRQDIEEKNLQLRQLVGDSYRDLIEGTDKIIDISTKCHSILGNISNIQENFASLAVSVTCTPGSGPDGKESVRKHQELHALGSRVKYILDSPEVIWGCLDGAQHLEAARRLLRVHEVRDQLHAAHAADVAAKFPLLSHQWPIVLKFRQQILDISASTLSSNPDLSSAAAADALAALAMLEGLDAAAALQRFLAARRQWAQAHLEQALAQAAAGAGAQPPGEVLAQLAQRVQSCVAQVGELFTLQQQPQRSQQLPAKPPQQQLVDDADGPPAPAPPGSLLQHVVQEDEADASELYFGSVSGAAEGANSPEAVAWRAKSSAVCAQLAPLQRVQVAQACTAWLSDVAAFASQHGLALLQQAQDADALLQAEQAVHCAMADWCSSSGDGAAAGSAGAAEHQAQQTPRAAGLGRTASTAAGAAAAAGSGSPKAGVGARSSVRQASDWELTCGAVLGERLELWQVLFHTPFLERCKQLISAALSDACSSVEAPLTATLEQAALHEPEPAGQLVPGAWPSFSSQASGPGEGAGVERSCSLSGGPWRTMSSLSRTASLLPGGQDDGAADFRNEVHAIQQLCDQRLHAALQAVLLLSAVPVEQPPQGGSGNAARVSGLLPGGGSRTLSLQHAGSTASVLRTASLQPGSPAAAAAAGSSAAAAACTAAGKQRAAQLESFAQQRCLELVQQLAARLQEQLQGLQQLEHGASSVEQVLLIARLCSALATSSSMLPALLGPPENWPAAARAGPAGAAVPGSSASATPASSLAASLAQGVSGLGPAAAALLRMHHPGLAGQQAAAQLSGSAAQLAALQQRLQGIANAGYACWAAWAARSLAAELSAALARDELLHGSSTPLSWVEVKLVSEDGGGADAASAGLLDLLDDPSAAAGDMCFALPACPSAAVLQLLSCACWETRRAGEHLITTDALQLLVWELHGAALGALQQLVARGEGAGAPQPGASATPAAGDGSSGSGVTEKGVLQLLFDQRLLRDVLGGGQPPSGALAAPPASANGAAGGHGGDAAAALAARKQLVSGLELQLQERLDPIDWATYEPHLWAHAQRYHARTAVLLGALGQLSRPYADGAKAGLGAGAGAGAAGGGGDINALNLLPVVPRFHYLPISTPTASALPRHRSAAAAAAGAGLGLLAAGAAPGGAPAAAAGQALPLASVSAAAADLAASLLITDSLGGSASRASNSAAAARGAQEARGAAAGSGAAAAAAAFLHPTADSAAAAGASALSALQARLQGSSLGAFGSLLGDRAAEVTAMAQAQLGLGSGLDRLGGIGGGLLSSFARRDGEAGGVGGGAR